MSSQQAAPNSQNAQTALTTPLLLLMAITTGIAVASNYYAQPLLRTISDYFIISETTAAFVVTVAQLGYALGLVLLVPLGDILERKRLIIAMMLLAIIGLLISACATSFILLLIGTALTGIFSVVAQVLVPYAATLASPAEKGKAVGIVMSGLLMGILLARTFSGVVSTIGGWNMVYGVAAIMMLMITIALAIRLPRYPATQHLTYVELITSIFALFKKFPVLRQRALLGGLTFAVFTVLWTPISYLLKDYYGYPDWIIGVFGLAGAAGALIAPVAGKLVDRGQSKWGTSAGLITLVVSWGLVYWAPVSIIALVAGIVLLDAAVQFVHIINMSEVYQLEPESRNRLNAGYMFSYFLGGVLGSVSAGFTYEHFKWEGSSILGALLSFLALVIWWFSKNRQSV